MMDRDNGTGWIADYYDLEELQYPEWLGTKTLDLPRRIKLSYITGNKFYAFKLKSLSDEYEWARCIIWIIENLEDGWCASGKILWLETEEDAVAFKLGCL